MSSAIGILANSNRLVSRRVRLEACLIQIIGMESLLRGPEWVIEEMCQKLRDIFLLHIESECELEGRPYDHDSALIEWYSSIIFTELMKIHGHAAKLNVLPTRGT